MARFHPFLQLPAELRRQIWTLAIQPRTITAYAAAEGGEDLDIERDEHDVEEKRYLVLAAQPPAILHACRESRSQLLPIFSRVVTAKETLVNFELDTISASDTCLPQLMQAPWSGQIRQLELEVVDAAQFVFGIGQTMANAHSMALGFINLRYVTIRNLEARVQTKESFEDNTERLWAALLSSHYGTRRPIQFQLTIAFPLLAGVEDLTESNYAKRGGLLLPDALMEQ